MPKANPAAAAAQAAASFMDLTSTEVNEVVEVCISAPMDGYPGTKECLWGLPLLIEGEPGIAKTARLKQLAKTVQVKAKSLFAAQHPPEDFSGALIPDGKGDANQICPLAQVRSLIKEGYGIIFLDEINGAPPATQGALQSFIHERVAGDAEMPGGIRIIAAQNPEEMATGGFRLSPALANRFLHLSDPGPNAREWAAWLMGGSRPRMQASLRDIEKTVSEEWPNLFPESQALFTGFIEKNPSLLHKRPDLSNPDSGKAWPSHRTWDFALRAWTTARILEKSDGIKEALINACVGEGAASIFLTYVKENDIPKPLDVLNGVWKLDPDRLDIILAAYTGAVAYVQQRPSREEKVKLAVKAWTCLVPLFDASLTDIVIPAAHTLIAEKLSKNSNDAVLSKAANQVLVPLAKSGVREFITDTVS
jgi:hypothetical protein